ncbi:MAG: class I SAM-dependent methyltransferase, partial [Candidatus Doudnabacteria bacterium]
MKTQIKIFGKSQQVNLPVQITPGKDDKLKEEETKKRPGMIKSFGLLLKAFGVQLGMFDDLQKQEIVEGETRTKDGKVYEIKRSKKNPNVRRLFKREEPETTNSNQKSEVSNQKPKVSLFGQQVDIFGGEKQEEKQPHEKEKSKEDLLWDEYEKMREEREKRPRKNDWDRQKKMSRIQGEIEDLHREQKNVANDQLGLSKLKQSKPSKEKPQKEKPEIEDLFTPQEKPARPTKKDKDELIENFGVSHLDSKVRAQRIEINKKVKELLSTKKNEEFTPEDKKLLAQYSGKGGTDEVSLNEYYTPDYVAKFQWNMLEKLGFKGGAVIEPSCGTGIFMHTAPDNALVTGIEYDETSSRIASILFPQQEIYHMPFEKFNNENFDKEYKAAIGNVPFGQRGETSALDPEKAKAYHVHEQYFLDRILDDLGEGGLASIIVPTGIMDNQLMEYRLELNKKAEFLGAIRMPTGVFKNANAQVTTDIVFFKKRPEAVIEALGKLEGDQLSKLYDTMILDAEFVNGTFFAKNPEYVFGTETVGNFGRKIWKGDITPEELEEAGELIKNFGTDYSILGDLGLKVEEEKELHVGDIITRNGRNYQLNENHRWERLDNIGERQIYLSEETQKILGIKTIAELNELRSDISRVMELSRDQIKELHTGFGDELDAYTSSNVQKSEMLKRAVVLGLAIKDFQTKMQRGIEKQYNNANGTFYEYEPVPTSDAQREAQQLSMLLDDFKARYGHPSKDAKLNAQMGKSSENPMLYLVSAFDSEGNLSKLFTDPKSFYNVYHSKVWTVNTYDGGNLLDTIAMLKGNGLSNSAES